jgi:AcrR family transcriptional regulator
MTSTRVDRPALIRRALIELVAERGFRGTSMAAVAELAGVAAGTAYVHYRSKDDVVLAAYCEVKEELGRAGVASVDPATAPFDRFRSLWLAIHAHLAADPDRARFLVQVESSPYAARAHAAAAATTDHLVRVTEVDDMASMLVDLPDTIRYDLGIGPAVRLVARNEQLDRAQLERVASGCWRSITRGVPA